MSILDERRRILLAGGGFPAEPTGYSVEDVYVVSQTWYAPEDGYYQIELYGASGTGGKEYTSSKKRNSGGGGGGGGTAISRVKMNQGDTIVLTLGGVGTTAYAVINSSLESYSSMSVTSGGNGGNSTSSKVGSGGSGGTASGGNYANYNGRTGGSGNTFYPQNDTGSTSAGSGGSGGYDNLINPGGAGEPGDGNGVSNMNKVGRPSIAKIYFGNTNHNADSNIPAEYVLYEAGETASIGTTTITNAFASTSRTSIRFANSEWIAINSQDGYSTSVTSTGIVTTHSSYNSSISLAFYHNIDLTKQLYRYNKLCISVNTSGSSGSITAGLDDSDDPSTYNYLQYTSIPKDTSTTISFNTETIRNLENTYSNHSFYIFNFRVTHGEYLKITRAWLE